MVSQRKLHGDWLKTTETETKAALRVHATYWQYLILLKDFALGQYTSSPSNRTYIYAKVATSSLALITTITSTHCAYPRKDGQAELAGGGWLQSEMVYLPEALHH